MKPLYALLLALLPASLAAASDNPASPHEGRKPPRPKAAVLGTASHCLPLMAIRETRIRDDWTIDFVGHGTRIWRNTLGARCPGLRARNAITYETSLTQLCDTDTVYVLETAGGAHRGPACALGPFVPVRLEKRHSFLSQ